MITGQNRSKQVKTSQNKSKQVKTTHATGQNRSKQCTHRVKTTRTTGQNNVKIGKNFKNRTKLEDWTGVRIFAAFNESSPGRFLDVPCTGQSVQPFRATNPCIFSDNPCKKYARIVSGYFPRNVQAWIWISRYFLTICWNQTLVRGRDLVVVGKAWPLKRGIHCSLRSQCCPFCREFVF